MTCNDCELVILDHSLKRGYFHLTSDSFFFLSRELVGVGGVTRVPYKACGVKGLYDRTVDNETTVIGNILIQRFFPPSYTGPWFRWTYSSCLFAAASLQLFASKRGLCPVWSDVTRRDQEIKMSVAVKEIGSFSVLLLVLVLLFVTLICY